MPLFRRKKAEPPSGGIDWTLERKRLPGENITDATMRDFRTSGVVKYVEVLDAAVCCPVCRAAYAKPKRRKVTEPIKIPVPGCTRPDGCFCCVSPIVD